MLRFVLNESGRLALGIFGAAMLAAAIAAVSVPHASDGIVHFLGAWGGTIFEFAHLRFGESAITGAPVIRELASRAPLTIGLVVEGIAVAAIVGIPVGFLFGAGPARRAAAPLVQVVAAAPIFCAGMALAFAASKLVHWPVPINGRATIETAVFPRSASEVQAILLPALMVGLAGAAAVQLALRRAAADVGQESLAHLSSPHGSVPVGHRVGLCGAADFCGTSLESWRSHAVPAFGIGSRRMGVLPSRRSRSFRKIGCTARLERCGRGSLPVCESHSGGGICRALRRAAIHRSWTEAVTVASPSTSGAQSLRVALRALGWIGLGLIAVAVSLSDFLANAPANATAIGPLLAPPSAAFELGTDILGRDMLSETLHGLSVTARSSLPAIVTALIFGALFGFIAARLPKPFALTLRWFLGILAAIPALLLAILIIGLTARGWAGVAAGLAAAPLTFVRAFDRASMQAGAVHSEYARATGISAGTLMRRDLVYEFSGTFSASAARALAAVIIILSTVSFLGFGTEPPHRDLGLMIAASKTYYLHAWWTAAFPALALMAVILFARLAAGLDEGERP